MTVTIDRATLLNADFPHPALVRDLSAPIPWVAKGIELGLQDAGDLFRTPRFGKCVEGGLPYEGFC